MVEPLFASRTAVARNSGSFADVRNAALVLEHGHDERDVTEGADRVDPDLAADGVVDLRFHKEQDGWIDPSAARRSMSPLGRPHSRGGSGPRAAVDAMGRARQRWPLPGSVERDPRYHTFPGRRRVALTSET